jgi:uncharacterized phage protein gp47/JayE
MAGLTATGLDIKRLEDILAELKAAEYANVSNELNLEATSLLGQFLASTSSQLAQLWELALAVRAARSPSQAEGIALDDVCEITGTYREQATPSTVTATVNVDAGTYAAGTLIAHPIGAPDRRFSNVLEVTASGDWLFQAETTGPQRCDAGTLTVIAESVVGFNSITNALDADLGTDIELDSSLRRRQALERTRPGSTTAEAVRTDVLDVEGVTLCTVLENDTDTTDGNGLPPHSLEAVVLGGDDEDVREAVRKAKAGGIRAYGDDIATIYDSQGQPHSIGFSRPDDVNIYISVTLTRLPNSYPGDNAMKQAIADWADANLSVGHDVLRARLFAEVFMAGLGSIINVASLTLGLSASPVGTADLTMTARQLPRFDTSRISITSSIVSGHP